MESSSFVSDSEWTTYINQSLYALYDILVGAYGDDYYVADPVTFTTDGSSDRYALPNGTNFSAAPALYKLLGVDIALSSSPDSYVTLYPFTMAERNKFNVPNFQTVYGITNLRYRVSGDYLWLSPRAAAGQTIQLWYVPVLTELSAEGDTFNSVSGWDEFVVIDAAIKAKDKEESDVTVLASRWQAVKKRIESAAPNRNLAAPKTVSDNFAKNTGRWPGQGSQIW